MKRVFLGIVLLWYAGTCFAQAPGPDDWDKKHADETYVYLYLFQQIDLHSDGSYTTRVRWKKRIQNELGRDEGEISVIYNKKRDTFSKLNATITTPDGKKHPFEKIQDLDIDGVGSYSDYRQKIISMPEVVVGSVIEYESERTSSQDAIKGRYSTALSHLDIEPFKEQLIVFSHPEEMPLYFKYLNTEKRPIIEHKDGRVIYSWPVGPDGDYDEDYKKENSLPPANDFMPRTCISTMKDWSELGQWIRDGFMKASVVTPEVEAEAREITKDKASIPDKVLALRDWVYKNLRFVAGVMDDHDLMPHPVVEVLKNKFGDCKDQAALLVAMLSSIGIEAYPVLVSPEDRGAFWKALPDPGVFDHMIVAVKEGGKYYFIDPQIEGYRVDEIPASLEYVYVFVLDSPEGTMMQLPAMRLEDKTDTVKRKTQLNPDGSAVQEGEIIFDRADSISLRKRIELATESEKRQFLETMENVTQGGRLVSHEFIGQDDVYGPLTAKLKMEIPQLVRPLGPYMVFGSTGTSWSEDFPDKSRKYPLWLPGENVNIKHDKYIIPPGFRVIYMPKDIRLESSWLDLYSSSRRHGRVIVREFRVHSKRGIIPPERYEEFKKFLVRAGELSDEAILIKRSTFLTWFQSVREWFGDKVGK